MIDEEAIETYILENFERVNPINSWGERSFFVNPGMKMKRGKYFATLKSSNGDNDKASNLDRENVYRLNIGLSPKDYEETFGPPPPRPSKGGIIDGDYNFTAIDIVTPHPVYGWMGWISILNPSKESFEQCKTYINSAYQKAFKAIK